MKSVRNVNMEVTDIDSLSGKKSQTSNSPVVTEARILKASLGSCSPGRIMWKACSLLQCNWFNNLNFKGVKFAYKLVCARQSLIFGPLLIRI